MKIRTDFVTNSSSSSFIFGEANGNSTTVKDVIGYTRDIAKKLLSVIELLDSIVSADGRLSSIKEQDGSRFQLEDEIEKNKSIVNTLEIKIKDEGLKSTWQSILFAYLYESDVAIIRKFAENTSDSEIPGMSDILDLRKVDDYDDILESLLWFQDELPNDRYKKLKNEMYNDDGEKVRDTSLLYRYFGEVAIVGECGYIPRVMVIEMYDKASYGCDHMG